MSGENVEGPRIQGEFKAATTDIDRRHGNPEMEGLSSGEKAAITRSIRYGDELEFEKNASPEKKEAIQRYREEQAGKSTPENAEARADDPLSNPKNREAQGRRE